VGVGVVLTHIVAHASALDDFDKKMDRHRQACLRTAHASIPADKRDIDQKPARQRLARDARRHRSIVSIVDPSSGVPVQKLAYDAGFATTIAPAQLAVFEMLIAVQAD